MSEPSKMPLRIIRDSREQAPFTFSGLPVEVEVGSLEAGDYSVAGFARRIAVERKELGDLVDALAGTASGLSANWRDCGATTAPPSSSKNRCPH